jgi:hypothetical protein
MRTYRSAKVPLLDEHGAVRGIAGVGTDLTDEVTYRERLEQLNASCRRPRPASPRPAPIRRSSRP